MPNLTLVVEDLSPLLVYSEQWTPGNDSLQLYSGGSYMQTDGTTASNVFFVFTGTNVNIFGAKRPNHGFYQITVDGKQYSPVNGNADAPGTFQTALFSSISLPNVQHTVALNNADAGRLVDLDFVSWTSPVGKDDEELIVNTLQESNPAFTYTPPDAWTNNPSNIATFSGGTGRASSKAGATMKLTFEGDAIALYGPVGPKGASYEVAINIGNALPNNYTTNKPFFRPNMLLYQATNLGPGSHEVTLRVLQGNDSSGESNTFAVDYAQVFTAPSLGGKALVFGTASSRGLSTGAVVGITLGGLLGVLALVGIVIWGILCYISQKHNRTFFYGFSEKASRKASTTTTDGSLNLIRPFNLREYASVSAESPPPSRPTEPGQHTPSQPSYNTANATATPSTAQWPSTGGQGSSFDPLLYAQQLTPNASTQEIVIPPFGSNEKYRPDRAPQLQAPPQGPRSRQNPAAVGAAWQSVSPVPETTEIGTNPNSLTLNTALEESSAPPPEYSQQPAVASTTASSFYAREAYVGPRRI